MNEFMKMFVGFAKLLFFYCIEAEANPNSPWMLFDYTRLKEAIIDYRNVIKFSSRFEGMSLLDCFC